MQRELSADRLTEGLFGSRGCESYSYLTYWHLSNGFAPHPSLPLMREVDSPQGEDGGRENYPSVKNSRFCSCTGAAAPKAPSDEGAVSVAD